MFGGSDRLRSWRPGPAGGLADDATGAIAGLLTLGACVAADVALVERVGRDRWHLRRRTVLRRDARRPAWSPPGSALLAFGAALASPIWNVDTSDAEQVVRLIVIGLGGGLAVGGAWLRERWAGAPSGCGLLDSVGAVADGSLPLAETLRRVTDVVVPTFADICIIDAIHEGGGAHRGSRSAPAAARTPRVRGPTPSPAAGAARVAGARRALVAPSPAAGARTSGDEELRRMANSDDDLEFLRTHGPAFLDRDPDPRAGSQPRRPDPDHRLVGAALRRRGRALRRDPRQPDRPGARQRRACSPTSRASSGGWTR